MKNIFAPCGVRFCVTHCTLKQRDFHSSVSTKNTKHKEQNKNNSLQLQRDKRVWLFRIKILYKRNNKYKPEFFFLDHVKILHKVSTFRHQIEQHNDDGDPNCVG